MCFKPKQAIFTLKDKPMKFVDCFKQLSSTISSTENDGNTCLAIGNISII